jgi:hypothetical protein
VVPSIHWFGLVLAKFVVHVGGDGEGGEGWGGGGEGEGGEGLGGGGDGEGGEGLGGGGEGEGGEGLGGGGEGEGGEGWGGGGEGEGTALNVHVSCCLHCLRPYGLNFLFVNGLLFFDIPQFSLLSHVYSLLK